jgi:hypothetical protein
LSANPTIKFCNLAKISAILMAFHNCVIKSHFGNEKSGSFVLCPPNKVVVQNTKHKCSRMLYVYVLLWKRLGLYLLLIYVLKDYTTTFPLKFRCNFLP